MPHESTNGHTSNGDGASTMPRFPLDRLPPHNIDLERQVLGSILLDNAALLEVDPILEAGDLYRDSHQAIFRAISGLRDRGAPVDLVTLSEELDRRGELAGVGGLEALMEILSAAPHSVNAAYHANIVREKAVARRLIDAANAILRDAYSNRLTAGELAARAEGSVFAAAEGLESSRPFTAAEVVAEALGRIRARANGELAGVPTGYKDLDDKLGCLANGELVILAARPSMGKTSLALGICERAAVNLATPTLLVSLEMGRGELGERLLSGLANVDGDLLKRPWRMHEGDRDRLERAADRIRSSPLHVDDAPARSMARIAAAARRGKARHGIGLVVVDYLQLIDGTGEGDKGLSRQEVVAKISRRIKELAKELDLPVLALSQLNRDAESRSDHKPCLADLRESGAIEQDADVVLFVHRPAYYDPTDRPGIAQVIVAKHRNGPTGVVELTFRPDLARFEDHHPEEQLP